MGHTRVDGSPGAGVQVRTRQGIGVVSWGCGIIAQEVMHIQINAAPYKTETLLLNQCCCHQRLQINASDTFRPLGLPTREKKQQQQIKKRTTYVIFSSFLLFFVSLLFLPTEEAIGGWRMDASVLLNDQRATMNSSSLFCSWGWPVRSQRRPAPPTIHSQSH